MTIERRTIGRPGSLKLHKRTEDGKEKEVFVGYASVFYDEEDEETEYEIYSGMRERVMPTAFDRALREGQDVIGTFNHNPDCLLGRCASGTMRLSVDKRGLRYEIDYDEKDDDHRTLRAKMERGDVTGSSFSFLVAPNGQKFAPGMGDADDVRELHDLDLIDVGPVSMPAYKATSAGMRSETEAEIRALCDAARPAKKPSELDRMRQQLAERI